MIQSSEVEIEPIVKSVFGTMANLDMELMDPPEEEDCEGFLAIVQITGAWIGTVVMGISPSLVRTSAAQMLDISDEEVEDDELEDVASALINMLGGNIKAELPRPSDLSLPTVVVAQRKRFWIQNAEMVEQLWFKCRSGTLNVALLVKNGENSN